jgi:hypothetical protein
MNTFVPNRACCFPSTSTPGSLIRTVAIMAALALLQACVLIPGALADPDIRILRTRLFFLMYLSRFSCRMTNRKCPGLGMNH